VSTEARPPRVEYRLTERGEELRALLSALKRFAGP
jgi:DNA-binding HxlR family transcriptional regulator